jgi:hypothetical protein
MHSDLHQKTHFKAVYEMFVNPVTGKQLNDEILKRAIRIAPTIDQMKGHQKTPNLMNSQFSENWLSSAMNTNKNKNP